MSERALLNSRREFLARGALFAFLTGSGIQLLTPAEARASGVPHRVLDKNQAQTLESLAEVLLPGSAKRGIAHFIDTQLAAPPADSLLMIKYLGSNPPFTAFYISGFAALNAAARHMHSRQFSELSPPDAHALVTAMSKGDIAGWNGPPPASFFFVLRNDAVDVAYGTVEGFEDLGVPYMPHIAPASRWGE